jgi:triphosphatase
MRIRVKKLRYAAEYLGEVFASKRTRKYLRRLVSLQDALGTLNDTVVAEHLLEQAGLAQSPALHLVRGWHACKAQAQLALLPDLWKAFARCKPFWNT